MKTTQDLLFLKQQKIEDYLSTHIQEALNEVAQAYLNFSKNKVNNPPSSFLWYNEEARSRAIALPALIESEERKALGIKWISSCPNNIKHNIPRASALILLNDYITGFPIAVLEGSVISATRTALSALIAVDRLHKNKTIKTFGIIGCGTIASTFMQCMQKLGWHTNDILLYDIEQKRADLFKTNYCPHAVTCNTIEEVTATSDVLLLTTTTLTPYISQTNTLCPGSIILNLSLRDIAANVILDAFNIVDDIDHVLSANTSPHLAFLECGHKQFIHGTISELIEGALAISENKIKIFSPMGMGMLDIALADLIYQHYKSQEDVDCIGNFFHERQLLLPI